MIPRFKSLMFESPIVSPLFAKAAWRIVFLTIGLWLTTLSSSVSARTTLNPADPLGFFTTLADKMLRNTFSFGVTNIPVYVNGQFVYTPAVNRVLQLAANVYDASTNSFYPDVFRPIFEHDASGNVFIVGYTNLSSSSGPNTVSGPADPQLILPVDIATLTGAGPAFAPITTNGVYVNVYGVPWIVGAKKYLPGFNQLSLINVVQVKRLLQVERTPEPDGTWGPVWTNHMYSLSISNLMSVSFWNSYSNNYPTNYPGSLNLSAYVNDTIEMVLTNSDHPGLQSASYFTANFALAPTVWPGSKWPAEGGGTPDIESVLMYNWTNVFLPLEIYKTGQKIFALPTDPDAFETNNHSCDPLPQFGLSTTNWLRAFIVDKGHVIDCVQLHGPTDSTNFTAALNDPNVVTAGQNYLWATNGYGNSVIPSWGYVTQMAVSRGELSPPVSAVWINPALPSVQGLNSVITAQDFLNSMFSPSSSFNYVVNGQTFTYSNSQSVVQAGYAAVRTIFVPYLYQVNDPLVHYQASDLNAGNGAVWSGNQSVPNGIWQQNNGVTSVPFLVPPTAADIPKSRYQPWGVAAPLALQSAVYNFLNSYNLTYKDPLIWSPDHWSFPTNLLSDLTGLGQVHRGTPWQTVYLKSSNVVMPGNTYGTNTWMAWTGDSDAEDAAAMAPVNDRQLVSLLVSLLNTNDATQLMSVNDTNTTDWLNLLNGISVYSNSASFPVFTLPYGIPLQTSFDTYVMSSNSPQAEIIANGIAQARAAQPNQDFYSIGDILSASVLAEDSPWLNTNNANQLQHGITDAVYEAIPAQLLLRLRPDSFGATSLTNGVVNLQFSGSDALSYAVQQSSDLVHWTTISTNTPVQGIFNIVIPPSPGSTKQFYRSMLLP